MHATMQVVKEKKNEKAGESGLERRENPWRDWSCKEKSVFFFFFNTLFKQLR